MIAFLDGVVEEVRDGSLVVRAGAVGLEVFVPAATAARAKVGHPLTLHTHFAVREDALTLYGFDDRDALRTFELLIGVSSVGPKLALAVLSALPLQVVAAAVANDDPALLAAAPGVGKRTAERIVLDLKARMPEDLLLTVAGPEGEDGTPAAPRAAAAGFGPEAEDAVQALIALGYREANVKTHVAQLAQDDPDAPAEALIRAALAKLR
ncbi:MAG: Holliday junction branch migration protein RuvA [Trueperaceae bacterium]|nr:Holliday junction branch migration protein RuvA [Trueperaceae bacterium]